MSEVMWRVLWITCAAIFVAYGSYLFFGSSLSAVTDELEGSIVSVDAVSAGKHVLKGVIVIPSECHGVNIKVRQLVPTVYHLDFETWQEPYRDCAHVPVLHSFETIVFAPSLGVTFVASLDGKVLNMHVIESYLKKSEQ